LVNENHSVPITPDCDDERSEKFVIGESVEDLFNAIFVAGT